MVFLEEVDPGYSHTCPHECPDCLSLVDDPEFSDAWLHVDFCVVEDVRALWAAGIRTNCSCCGHTGNGADAFIVVFPEDAQKARDLGYTEAPPRFDHCVSCGVFFRPKQFGLEMDGNV